MSDYEGEIAQENYVAGIDEGRDSAWSEVGDILEEIVFWGDFEFERLFEKLADEVRINTGREILWEDK